MTKKQINRVETLINKVVDLQSDNDCGKVKMTRRERELLDQSYRGLNELLGSALRGRRS